MDPGSSLESITSIYIVKILVGEQVCDGLKGFLYRQVDWVSGCCPKGMLLAGIPA
jgi:hypothetical protein